jgi:hypothetical protein
MAPLVGAIITVEGKAMKDQHTQITGYRDLSEEEVALMNECKELAIQCGELIKKLSSIDEIDHRSAALAKTNLQQGFMWATRAIARPTTF